ncbi:hypothetical protein BJ322DRAFT_1010425 [Thelephora terrestris]|uniref:Protein kinase domain-containing protein n=1 Tax=Thelephora terrestris TaxID=56493 RepID=A0A9P6L4F0_9AGAM|nr:hypothetical protein BJ322DRAFT_1010425 [Thelephora terrestris]
MDPPQTSSANDIFSLSDQTLANRLQFIEEIGYGNWGSVWRCCPKPDPSSKSPPNKYEKVKLAVKLVHRSKTQTTAARVRSLWNEMKVVRSLKNETHPSVISFCSFIITPSYALITMAYLPRLIPVEVDEPIAKIWFKSLLSGVEFLHSRGVVHNDIKPANILLSDEEVPVLVDFGFAEKYDMGSPKAFRSNLAYGTPEYLSPERARGHYHDTRKSDVWSLGITFFEILIGRTPFEHVEGEQFSTKEDLEKYWARTVRGKWVGSYKMTRTLEKLIRRMVAPNADVRCFASEALDDSYWIPKEALKAVQKAAHRKSASLSQAALSAMHIDVDTSRLLDIVSPFTTRTLKDRKSHNKENLTRPDVKINTADQSSSLSSAASSSKKKHARSQSQPKVAVKSGQATLPSRTALSPVNTNTVKVRPTSGKENSAPKESRVSKPKAVNENSLTRTPSDRRVKKPVGPRKPPPTLTPDKKKKKTAGNENATSPKDLPTTVSRSAGRVLTDLSNAKANPNVLGAKSRNSNSVWLNRTTETAGKGQNESSFASLGKGSVKERWMDWERERERLREMDKDKIRETDDEDTNRLRRTSEELTTRSDALEVKEDVFDDGGKAEEKEAEAENIVRRRDSQGCRILQTLLAAEPVTVLSPRSQQQSDSPPGLKDGLPVPRVLFGSGLSVLKQNMKASIDKSVQLCRASTLLSHGRPSTTMTMEDSAADHTRAEQSARQSWEGESLIQQANSSLPGIRQMVRSERVGEDNQVDRMSLWLQSVEKVVADARQNFEAARPIQPVSLAPAPPPSRRPSQRRTTQRMPRKILAANQIFNEDGDASIGPETPTSAPATVNSSTFTVPEPSQVSVIVEETSILLSETPPVSPARRRRATVVTMSPETKKRTSGEVVQGSPSKKPLFGPIFPRAELERELERLDAPTPPVRLSALVHPSVFIAPQSPDLKIDDPPVKDTTRLSPQPMRPPPGRTITGSRSLDSPNTKRRVADEYDRLLSATTGIKKVGLGYQSDVNGPIANILSTDPYPSSASSKRTTFFHSTRRAMPPPVSSEDWRKTASVDELARMTPSASEPTTSKEEKAGSTVSAVKRAFMALTGRTGVKRLSQRLI